MPTNKPEEIDYDPRFAKEDEEKIPKGQEADPETQSYLDKMYVSKVDKDKLSLGTQLGHSAQGGAYTGAGGFLQNLRPYTPGPDVQAQRTLEDIQRRNPVPTINPFQKQITNVMRGVDPNTLLNKLAFGGGEAALSGLAPMIGPESEAANLFARFAINNLKRIPGQMAYGAAVAGPNQHISNALSYGVGTPIGDLIGKGIGKTVGGTIKGGKDLGMWGYNKLFPKPSELPSTPKTFQGGYEKIPPSLEDPSKVPEAQLEDKIPSIDITPLAQSTMAHVSHGMSLPESNAAGAKMIFDQAQQHEAKVKSVYAPLFDNPNHSFRPVYRLTQFGKPSTADLLAGRVPELPGLDSKYLQNITGDDMPHLSSDLKKLHQQFTTTPSVSNAHILYKQYGEEMSNLKNKAFRDGLKYPSGEDGTKYDLYKNARNNLNQDIPEALSKVNPDYPKTWEEGKKYYQENVVPYRSTTNISGMARGDITHPNSGMFKDFIDPKNKDNISKITQELGPDFSLHVIRDALGASIENKSPEKLPDTWNTLKNKGYWRHDNPIFSDNIDKIDELNKLNDQIKNENKNIEQRNTDKINSRNEEIKSIKESNIQKKIQHDEDFDIKKEKYRQMIEEYNNKQLSDHAEKLDKIKKEQAYKEWVSKLMRGGIGAATSIGLGMSHAPWWEILGPAALSMGAAAANRDISDRFLSSLASKPILQKGMRVGKAIKPFIPSKESIINPLAKGIISQALTPNALNYGNQQNNNR